MEADLCVSKGTRNHATTAQFSHTSYILYWCSLSNADNIGWRLDEFIRRRDWWQGGDAAFCQITLGIYDD